MSIKYGFFDSVDGDRKYSAEDIGRYLQGIISSGVYSDNTSSLQVLAGTGMQVEVQPGRAMLHYHFMENDEPLTLTLSAGGTLDRIDAIVARLDMERRICEIAVKEGTPATTPTAPTMFRTDNTKEYMLASVYVAKLATMISQENITDTRHDTTVCGWVRGIVKQEATSVPTPSSGQALYIPTVNEDGDGYELMPTDPTLSFEGAVADAKATGDALAAKLPKSGGTMTGAITTKGIVLTEGTDYGNSLPSSAPKGKLFFCKVVG